MSKSGQKARNMAANRYKGQAKPSIKQKRAFRALLEHKDKPAGQVLKENGYSSYSQNPTRWLQQPSVQQLCEEFGLTDELIMGSLRDDITAKPANRTQELKLAAQLKGYLIDRKDVTTGGMPLVVPNELYEREKARQEAIEIEAQQSE